MSLLLGIDIGTSSVKAVLVEHETMRLIAAAGEEYPLQIPQAGYAEQSPDHWWRATVAATKRALAAAQRDDVAAISFSGQMHGTVLLDAAYRPLQDAIIWADQRSGRVIQSMLQAIGEEQYTTTTGTLPSAGFMASTLWWLRQYNPTILEQAAHILLPKDYVRLQMTGVVGTDVSDAAGSGLFDIQGMVWAQTIADHLGVAERLPDVVCSWEMAGELTPGAAQLLGLRAGIPVIAGCADQPAQALGNGIISSGTTSVTIGSGGQVFVPIDAASGTLQTDPRLHVFNHAAPGWYALGAILSAGLSMRWLRGILGMADDADAYAQLSAEAAAIAAGADGLLFLPYLNGERTPYMDSCARGGFIGLGSHHTRAHMARAVMEGVAFALRQATEIAESLAQPADVLIGSGGGVESMVWRQILADVMARPIRKSLAKEQAGVGAALLGGVGIGAFLENGDAQAQFAHLQPRLANYDDPLEPTAANQALYEDRYAQFTHLYDRLKDDIHRLAQCEK